jgi:hypothetical protein
LRLLLGKSALAFAKGDRLITTREVIEGYKEYIRAPRTVETTIESWADTDPERVRAWVAECCCIRGDTARELGARGVTPTGDSGGRFVKIPGIPGHGETNWTVALWASEGHITIDQAVKLAAGEEVDWNAKPAEPIDWDGIDVVHGEGW